MAVGRRNPHRQGGDAKKSGKKTKTATKSTKTAAKQQPAKMPITNRRQNPTR